MKNKSINSKIDTLSSRIKSIKSKAENAKYLKESGTFQTLESELEAAIALQKEVQALKDLLKTKTKELEEGVKTMKRTSKDARKILKKNKKPEKLSRKKKTEKVKSPAIPKIQGNKMKMGKSREKPMKPKK
jgi:hypothetical protein